MSTSPCSTVLGRSSAMKRGRSDTFGLHRSDMFTLPHSLEENLSVLVLAAVVVAAVVAYVVGDHYAAVAAQQSWQEVFQNPVLAGVALLAVLVCTAWVTAHAYMHSDHFCSMGSPCNLRRRCSCALSCSGSSSVDMTIALSPSTLLSSP